MYVQVRMLKGLSTHLWYRVPTNLQRQCCVGTIVQVPLRERVVPAVIVWRAGKPDSGFSVRDIQSVEPFPRDNHFHPFVSSLASYHRINPITFSRRIAHFLGEKERKVVEGRQGDAAGVGCATALTDEQQHVVDAVEPALTEPRFMPVVLHGVTGSGKTEVYKQLLVKNSGLKKSALLLLPEVTLAVEFERRLRSELGDAVAIHGFHSATSAKDKLLLWQKLVAGEPVVIVGVHLPVLLPVARLGLIIVDEEHEVGYQEKKHPRVHTRDAVVMRAHTYGIPIVLGSATPSVSTLYNVQARGWRYFRLERRFAGSFPAVRVARLSDGGQRHSFWITRELQRAIADRLVKKEQVIIFINRRGYSFFVQCKRCSYIFSCQLCSVSLTLHSDGRLSCHYCGSSQQLPSSCPGCQAGAKELLKKGVGTQQVVSILEKMFPRARIARADLDSTVKRKRWQETMSQFADGEIDIMVGTQTITKGYDFANVTLVGILWADLNLHFPVYNAAETTLQQLVQVAGRAGRTRAGAEVIVQMLSEDTIFSYLREQDYERFCRGELTARRESGYPPFKRLAEIELRNESEQVIEAEAIYAVEQLLAGCADEGVHVLGPARPPVHKIKQVHIRRIYIKGCSMQKIGDLLDSVNFSRCRSTIIFTPNPVS